MDNYVKMAPMETDKSNYYRLMACALFFVLTFGIMCTFISIFLPADSHKNTVKVSKEQTYKVEEIDYDSLFSDSDFSDQLAEVASREDAGLVLYRQMQSRAAVEWFYTRITNSREVTQAILKNADKFDIPLTLAFALAHTESRFKITALNKNVNGSIDRGLYQLNSSSFPKLSESQFYDPEVSAYYGLSHLKYCLDSAGNEIAALAMYNAGTSKVRKNNTPQITLNYISQIQNYKKALEENFSAEVVAVFDSNGNNKLQLSKR